MTVIARTSLFAALLMLTSSYADAGNLVVGRKAEINVDPNNVAKESADLWAKYGPWCAIKDWHPAIKGCEEVKEGDTTFRLLTLKDGGKIKEKLLETGTLSYKYEIVESPLPVKNYTAQFSVTPDDDDLDEVNIVWAATFDAEGKPDKEARKVIDGIFKDGINSIKKATGGDKD
jgi:hypothetical protein